MKKRHHRVSLGPQKGWHDMLATLKPPRKVARLCKRHQVIFGDFCPAGIHAPRRFSVVLLEEPRRALLEVELDREDWKDWNLIIIKERLCGT